MTIAEYGRFISKLKPGDVVRFYVDKGIVKEKQYGRPSLWESVGRLQAIGLDITVDQSFIDRLSAAFTTPMPVYDFFEGRPEFGIVKENFSINFNTNMLFFRKYEPEKETEKIEKRPAYVFDETNKASIIKEMISKVDKKRLVQLLSNVGSYESAKIATKSVVDMYIEKWAEAKWKFYVLFEQRLSVNQEIEVDATDWIVNAKTMELSYKYPQYAEVLRNISPSDYISNVFNSINLQSIKCYPFFARGMRVSDFIHTLFGDEAIDSFLSSITKKKKIETTVYLSIDPYDYLTHWNSKTIQAENRDFRATGVSFMLDPSTMIAYCASDVEFAFDMKFKFSGNSKIWSQIINVDLKNFAAIFSTQYPTQNAHAASEARYVYEDLVDKFIGNKHAWSRSSSINGRLDVHEEFLRFAAKTGEEVKSIFLKTFEDPTMNVEIGCAVLYDVYDGTHISKTSNRRLKKEG